MLENSFGLTFFLKTPRNKENIRFIYLRITVDGIPKETSTKRKWDMARWDQKAERAVGNKEDARALNSYLDTLVAKMYQCKSDLLQNQKTITSQRIMDYVLDKIVPKVKVMEEFQLHNEEMKALIPKEYAKGTLNRFVITKSHVQEFMRLKYDIEDIEFRDLNYEFIKDFDFYLRTVKNCANNTSLKYITNFKKIVLRAIDKEIIPSDPFKRFKTKKTKLMKLPLNSLELAAVENHVFSTPRLAIVRDVFVFQCYTGLAYIDVYNLRKENIKIGIDGKRWIISSRQKTDSSINVPLLPKAIEIMDCYADHPICVARGTVLPVKSNQKMNEYLHEIAELSGLNCTLNTHKARRTFASTITLNTNVPIHVVKEMLGHASVKQTEEYAITEQQTIGREMGLLVKKLHVKDNSEVHTLERLGNEIMELKVKLGASIAESEISETSLEQLQRISQEVQTLKARFERIS